MLAFSTSRAHSHDSIDPDARTELGRSSVLSVALYPLQSTGDLFADVSSRWAPLSCLNKSVLSVSIHSLTSVGACYLALLSQQAGRRKEHEAMEEGWRSASLQLTSRGYRPRPARCPRATPAAQSSAN